MKTSFWCLDISFLCSLFYFAGNSKKKLEEGTADPTSALRGTIYTICKILSKRNPTYLVAAIDSKESFRKEIYPEYKAQRKEREEGYLRSVEQVREMLDLLGIPQICVNRYEADDVLCTLAEEAKKLEIPYVGVTQDKDFFQCLVKGEVGAYHKYDTWEFFSVKDAEEKWGVPCKCFVEFQCIVGDLCDNIIAARGLGPKRAAMLLNKYSDLKTIYENISELSVPFQKSLEELAPRLDTVRKLVTLVKNVGNVCPVLDDFEVADFKLDRAGFRKLLERNDLIQVESLVLDLY